VTGAIVSVPDEGAEARERAVRRALAAMRPEGEERLPLAALAEIAGFSPFHFARLFRHATGIPPGKFQAALRLERAKRLLLTTDLSVTEICFAVGYDSLGTFTTRFTELVGVPPGRLRRLPEEVDRVLGRLASWEAAPATVGGDRGAIGGLVGADGPTGPVFVGLFPAGIAAGRPVAGTDLPRPGPYRLTDVPDGRYHLLAAALPPAMEPRSLVLPGDGLRVGHTPAPIRVRAGRVDGATTIALRPPLPTEPPLLVALATALLSPPGSGRQPR
jgi:AraC-like DNA-binding protein